jgi:hypothetical protein
MTGYDHPTGLHPQTGDRWLTYNEIGDMLGVSPEAARAIARRGKWQRQTANAVGRVVRVLVPADRLRLAAANGDENSGRRAGPDQSGRSQRSNPDVANGHDESGQRPDAVESGLSQPQNTAAPDSGQRSSPDSANGYNNSGQRAGPGESGREQDRSLAALHEIAETFMAPVREQLADLRVQVTAERERADRERDRADRAEVRAREAETRAADFQAQLQAEMVEHRRVVAVLTERIPPPRRSWWRWRSRR